MALPVTLDPVELVRGDIFLDGHCTVFRCDDHHCADWKGQEVDPFAAGNSLYITVSV